MGFVISQCLFIFEKLDEIWENRRYYSTLLLAGFCFFQFFSESLKRAAFFFLLQEEC